MAAPPLVTELSGQSYSGPIDLDGVLSNAVDYGRDYSIVAKLADWGIRMHMGLLFGWLNQLMLLVVAMGLVTVIVRGYRMWWLRRPTRGSQWAVGRRRVPAATRREPARSLVVDAVLGRVKANGATRS